MIFEKSATRLTKTSGWHEKSILTQTIRQTGAMNSSATQPIRIELLPPLSPLIIGTPWIRGSIQRCWSRAGYGSEMLELWWERRRGGIFLHLCTHSRHPFHHERNLLLAENVRLH